MKTSTSSNELNLTGALGGQVASLSAHPAGYFVLTATSFEVAAEAARRFTTGCPHVGYFAPVAA